MATLCAAVRLLAERGVSLRRASSVYETAPVGFTAQPAFLNAVIEVETDLAPAELLSVTQDVERALGRQRTTRWGPRTLDLDILLYDGAVVAEGELRIPHPRMHERRFVLLPLTELEPDIAIPGVGPARECLAVLDGAEQQARVVGALPCAPGT